MSNAFNKTVLIRDVDADWYAGQLRELCPQYTYIPATDSEAALNHAAKADIIIGLAPYLDQNLIAAASRLEWVQALTAGVDNLLAMPALRADVTLSNCNGFHGPQMSELAFLMMLSLNRDAPRMQRNQDQKKWERWPQRLLFNKTVTVVGVGAIAEGLAKRCKAFDMTIIGVSDGRATAPNFDKMVKRDALLSAAAECDFLIALTPYDAKTHHIIDAQVFDAMPAHSYLINLSRGGCVDEAALLAALQNGDIAGAGLDVFAKEPLPESDPLWAAPNILVTPHIGGMADIYKQQALPLVARNLNAFATSGPSGLNGLVKRN
ncbi:D-2-hydroxyacid dehydrogenase [Pseudorhodobacter sp. W20_MBD10_FR17]|uniref:D-2-hydroxyacid dehydrogenase n=1 Tax=Pseudorhodobacter sp. W20_MBD10_FR17 TaxID=3240266 RepID=UPI003F98AD9B